jgi:hypothetical protein
MIITVLILILNDHYFQNSYASKDNFTGFKISLIPFNSHIADQAKDGKAYSSNDLPFP